jgi:hypothetical protein
VAVVPLALIAGQACSGSQGGSGELATGGALGSGGASLGGATSGNTGVGGSSLGQGGTSTGGASAVTGGFIGIGGALGTGGSVSVGGATNTGGTAATGGATNAGGASTTGGTNNAGGAAVTGGSKSAGGTATTGGTKSTGGASSVGGTAATGGTKNAGGASSIGGTAATGGMKSTGGASTTGGTTGAGGGTGTPVCASVAEGAKATLTCPQGQIISSVSFASFGTPTGTCGNFMKGTCDAVASVTRVQSICVGRNTCSVPAAVGTFGDPCNSTTKNLDIQVTCAPGTPIIGPTSPYKGVANSPAAQLAALGATWCYNWGTTRATTDCNDPLFVPMIWGGGSVASALQTIGNAGYKTVLAFNEPNKTTQSNMTVDAAIALWPTLTSNPNIRVGSPAVSDDGRAWLESFMTQAQTLGLRVDFIAMHWYGWNAGSCVASQLEGAVNWASQWGLPVWITEFGCMGSSNPDEQTVLSFYNNAVTMLRNHPLVERYAWYPWNTYNNLYDTAATPAMTSLGTAFAAAPQYHP